MLTILAKGTNIKVAIGEGSIVTKCHILVTTPGYFSNKMAGKVVLDLSKVNLMIYDEADELFINETNQKVFEVLLNQKVAKQWNLKIQHILFSATIDESVQESISKFLQFQAFTIKKQALKLKGVKQYKILVDEHNKREILKQLYGRITSTYAMIFVNSKKTATFLKEYLAKLGLKPEILISGMTFEERDKVIDEFRQEQFNALISTNVLARGIDIPQVDIVINFDIPVRREETGYFEPDYANYLHRVGRTGRFGTDGVALTFMKDDVEELMMDKIGKFYEQEIEQIKDLDEFFNEYKQMRKYLFEAAGV